MIVFCAVYFAVAVECCFKQHEVSVLRNNTILTIVGYKGPLGNKAHRKLAGRPTWHMHGYIGHFFGQCEMPS